MEWLVEHGPLHEDPPLPAWILKHLVRSKRIARLRRGLYLAPHRQTGQMLPLPVIAASLVPEGFLSFYGALSMYGLTDQDPAIWGVVCRSQHASIRYGRQRLHFIPWSERLRVAKTKRRVVGQWIVRIATPVQAFCDALEVLHLTPGWPELLHVLIVGLSTRKLTLNGLRAQALQIDSIVLARRLGLLLEMATDRVDPALQSLARRSRNWTSLGRAQTEIVRDSKWRLLLPRGRDEIAAAAR